MEKIIDSAKFLLPFREQFRVSFMQNLKIRPAALYLKKKVGKGENLIILLGSSGAGRDTVLEELLNLIHHSERIKRTTTRQVRKNSLDETQMFFIKQGAFLRAFKKGEIIFAGRYLVNRKLYGVTRAELSKLKNKKNIYFFECTLLSLPLKKLFPKSKLILLLPPSINFLKTKLKLRRDSDWLKRFKNSCLEIKTVLSNIKEMVEAGFVDLAIINSNSKRTAQIIKAIKNKRYADKLLGNFFHLIKYYDK